MSLSCVLVTCHRLVMEVRDFGVEDANPEEKRGVNTLALHAQTVVALAEISREQANARAPMCT